MSGGRWDYQNDNTCCSIFGWNADPVYGLGGKQYREGVQYARHKDPLNNKLLSELVYDVFCLLHSYDWAVCGDTCKEDYDQDVKYFIEKWLKTAPASLIEREIETSVDELRRSLIDTFLPFGERTSPEAIADACDACKITYGEDGD